MPKRLVHRRAARYLERMDARLKEQLVAKLELLTSRPSRCNNTRNRRLPYTGCARCNSSKRRINARFSAVSATGS